MISPAVILREYLVDALLLQEPSGAASWPVYLISLPDGNSIEDDAACLSDEAGNKDGRLMAGTTIQHYGVQLRVRSIDYQTGWNKANAIGDDFDSVLNEDIVYGAGTYRIHNISRLPVVSLGNEEGTKRRFLFKEDLMLTISQIV